MSRSIHEALRGAAALALLFVLTACGTPDRAPSAPTQHMSDAAPAASRHTADASPVAPQVSAADVLRDPTSFDAKRIRVVGEVRPGTYRVDFGGANPRVLMSSMACTELYCPPGECCNSCHGHASVVSGTFGLRLVGKDGKPFRCGGNECAIKCTPPRSRYEIVGTVRLPVGVGPIDLVVEKLERQGQRSTSNVPSSP